MPAGRSAVSTQYTSGPRSSATHPRTASTRGCGRVTRGGIPRDSTTRSPAVQDRVRSAVRAPAGTVSGPAPPISTLADSHHPGIRSDSVHGVAGVSRIVTATSPLHG